MGRLRRLLADRLTGGMLAALLAYALLFQAVGGSIAGASMAAAMAASREAHAAHGTTRPGLPECCAELCAVACAAGSGLAPDIGSGELGPAHLAVLAAPRPAAARVRPRHHRAFRQGARAPPHLSA